MLNNTSLENEFHPNNTQIIADYGSVTVDIADPHVVSKITSLVRE